LALESAGALWLAAYIIYGLFTLGGKKSFLAAASLLGIDVS